MLHLIWNSKLQRLHTFINLLLWKMQRLFQSISLLVMFLDKHTGLMLKTSHIVVAHTLSSLKRIWHLWQMLCTYCGPLRQSSYVDWRTLTRGRINRLMKPTMLHIPCLQRARMYVWEQTGHCLYFSGPLFFPLCLICLCRCLPVYSMGCSVGSLEHLHHLFLPERGRLVQGETFSSKFSSV